MSAEAIENAYRKGFNEGALQENQYECGVTPRPVKRCWEEFEAKAELDKTDADRFAECIERATKIVGTWPGWKQNLLGGSPSLKEPRKPL